MDRRIQADLNRYSDISENRAYWKAILFHPGARFMMVYRKCKFYKKSHPLGIIFRIWFKLITSRFNVEIPHSSNLGKGLYFGHFMNIVINQNVVIGENCNIMQGVTIGHESRGNRKGSPKIGDRVLFGPNSVIVGNIKIGSDVLIAPLSFVNFDVPDFSVVMGNPGKIVSNKGSIGYINKILNKQEDNIMSPS